MNPTRSVVSRREANARYNRSPKGRARSARYDQSPKRKATHERYEDSLQADPTKRMLRRIGKNTWRSLKRLRETA